MFLVVVFIVLGHTAWADFPKVVINGLASNVTFPIPTHHGLVAQIEAITDPNLSGFEVHVKEDNGTDGKSPLPPWQLYHEHLKPSGTGTVNIPYRNDIVSLRGKKKYCLRIRARYGNQISPWTIQCGVTLETGEALPGDADEDGLTNEQEYLSGLDIYNPDTDGDKLKDGEEEAIGKIPTSDKQPIFFVDYPDLDLGEGDPYGGHPNQHGVLSLRNSGEELGFIKSVTIKDADGFPGSSAYFQVGDYPKSVIPISPKNYAHIPISFYPKKRGDFAVQVEVMTDTIKPIPIFTVQATGVEIPDCQVSPTELDFGTIQKDDQAVLVQEVTLANKPLPGDTAPPNPGLPWSFTLESTMSGTAPGIRGYTLQKDEEIKIPVLFQHKEEGDFSGELRILSGNCVVPVVPLKAKVVAGEGG